MYLRPRPLERLDVKIRRYLQSFTCIWYGTLNECLPTLVSDLVPLIFTAKRTSLGAVTCKHLHVYDVAQWMSVSPHALRVVG